MTERRKGCSSRRRGGNVEEYRTWLRGGLQNILAGNVMWISVTCERTNKQNEHQLYGHLPPISPAIQVRRARRTEHNWWFKDGLKNDVLLWITTQGHTNVGRLAKTYMHQLSVDTGCCLEDSSEVIGDRDGRWERVRELSTVSMNWWGWWWYISPPF